MGRDFQRCRFLASLVLVTDTLNNRPGWRWNKESEDTQGLDYDEKISKKGRYR
jgi:hypothetical protein